MNKIVTESPDGLKVAITQYNSGLNPIEIEAEDLRGNHWSLWLDNIADVVFLADVLNDYINDRGLRKEVDNGRQ